MSIDQGTQVQYVKFVVNEAPYCVWGTDLHERNLSFVTHSIDPSYFEYAAMIHSNALANEDHRQRAALSLRTAYAHGLETFFALVFATIQAPGCVIAWLPKYLLGDLPDLVRKVGDRQFIYSKLPLEPVSWKTISDTIFTPFLDFDTEETSTIKNLFSRALTRFATDFLSDEGSKEYNSFKHGFRVKQGGFRIALGSEETPGVQATPERMRSLGGSDFGTSFYYPERVDAGNRSNIYLKHYSRNWKPANLVAGLQLMSIFLRNLVTYLKYLNGVDASTLEFGAPTDHTLFTQPWSPLSAPSEMQMSTVFTAESVPIFSPEQILDAYNGPADQASAPAA